MHKSVSRNTHPEQSPYDSFCVKRNQIIQTNLGHVDLAECIENKQLVIVKTSKLAKKQLLGTLEDPHAEVRILERLSGCECGAIYVPQLLGEWLEEDGNGLLRTHHYAMTYGGMDLMTWLKVRESTDLGYLSESEVKTIFLQIVRAVSFLHSKLIAHMDLKPENILIDLDNKDHITVCDFGMAQCLTKAGQLHVPGSGGIRGTPLYVAPELIRGGSYVAEQVDMYSLGIVLFILLMGCLPFRKSSTKDKAYRYIHQSRRIDHVINIYRKDTTIQPLSQPCVDLLSNLICFPEDRLSMEQVLQHPWLDTR